jgi:penicillin amidase/acyl-homoserine-lactone acylase
LPADPDVQQAAAILRDWDLQTNKESVGATIFELTLHFASERDGVSLAWDALTHTAVPTDALVEGLTQAVAFLREHYGRIEVPWSEVNRLRRGDVDLGVAGAPDIVHAVYGELEEDGRFRGTAGDAYVLLVTWDANGDVRSESVHQYGSATSVENSPHYADQAPLFVNQQLKPVWYDEADIRAHLEREYAPGQE